MGDEAMMRFPVQILESIRMEALTSAVSQEGRVEVSSHQAPGFEDILDVSMEIPGWVLYDQNRSSRQERDSPGTYVAKFSHVELAVLVANLPTNSIPAKLKRELDSWFVEIDHPVINHIDVPIIPVSLGYDMETDRYTSIHFVDTSKQGASMVSYSHLTIPEAHELELPDLPIGWRYLVGMDQKKVTGICIIPSDDDVLEWLIRWYDQTHMRQFYSPQALREWVKQQMGLNEREIRHQARRIVRKVSKGEALPQFITAVACGL